MMDSMSILPSSLNNISHKPERKEKENFLRKDHSSDHSSHSRSHSGSTPPKKKKKFQEKKMDIENALSGLHFNFYF